MADIELVIKIDEEQYKFIKQSMTINKIKYYPALLFDICERIKDGIPLPKGHGRLIDANDLDVTTITTDDYSGNDVLDIVLKEDIDDAPTIIEADAEREE